MYNTVISADAKGLIEYWDIDTFELPTERLTFRLRSETDLFDFAKVGVELTTSQMLCLNWSYSFQSKCIPKSIDISPDGKLWASMGSDMHVRVFKFESGKIYKKLDESVENYKAMQTNPESTFKIDAVDFGRRLAIELQLAQAESAPPSNVIFDQSGYFILYPTMLGIKLVNLVTDQVHKQCWYLRFSNLSKLFSTLVRNAFWKGRK